MRHLGVRTSAYVDGRLTGRTHGRRKVTHAARLLGGPLLRGG